MYGYSTIRGGQELPSGVVVGIEVVDKSINLSTNIDPQHTGKTDIAACQVALLAELPPTGATLVTQRADADSVCAMAVLTLRANGVPVSKIIENGMLGDIAIGDCAAVGPWRSGYRPPQRFRAASVVAMDHKTLLRERVGIIADALMGKIELPTPEDFESDVVVLVAAGGLVAVSLGEGERGRGAISAGYQHKPVVIALNDTFSLQGEKPYRKYTVARWNATIPMNWNGMLRELEEEEPGWGGSTSICGSPIGEDSVLPLITVVKTVEKAMG